MFGMHCIQVASTVNSCNRKDRSLVFCSQPTCMALPRALPSAISSVNCALLSCWCVKVFDFPHAEIPLICNRDSTMAYRVLLHGRCINESGIDSVAEKSKPWSVLLLTFWLIQSTARTLPMSSSRAVRRCSDFGVNHRFPIGEAQVSVTRDHPLVASINASQREGLKLVRSILGCQPNPTLGRSLGSPDDDEGIR